MTGKRLTSYNTVITIIKRGEAVALKVRILIGVVVVAVLGAVLFSLKKPLLDEETEYQITSLYDQGREVSEDVDTDALIELLRQATVNSAIIAGVIDKAGTIKVGKWADFCIVDGKPDEDIDVMTKLPAHVIIGGQKAV